MNEEKRQSSNKNTKMNHFLALSDKVSKAMIVKTEDIRRKPIKIELKYPKLKTQ
jgi:hypothetical protein